MRVRCDSKGLDKAEDVLAKGGIVVFPTDTVYGMGCSPFDADAVRRIYQIKNRSPGKPLPILTYSKETAEEIAEFDVQSRKIADRMWPGGLTIILKSKDAALCDSLVAKEKIAVRVPDHQCTLALLKRCRHIVGTSANASGAGSTADPAECEDSMSGYDLLLDGGRIESAAESTIIEMVKGRLEIRRGGKIRRDEILRTL